MHAARPPSVSCAYARALLDCLRRDGVDPVVLFGRQAVATLDDARQRMPLTQWLAMFERAVNHTGDASLPLRVGQGIQPHHYGVLGYLTMSAGTLLEAIARLERYETLVGEISQSRLLVTGNQARLIWQAPPDSPASPLLASSSLAGWISYARWLLNRPDQACDVEFAHPSGPERELAEQIFRGAVHYDCPDYALVFDATLLQHPVSHADSALQSLMRKQADEELAQLHSKPDWLLDLEQRIDEALPDGRVQLAELAPDSSRSLQRRLASAGLRFQQVLDQRRQLRAEQLLADERLSLTDIAFLLGYAEHSAFTRAFKRWTGDNPDKWRRQQLSR